MDRAIVQYSKLDIDESPTLTSGVATPGDDDQKSAARQVNMEETKTPDADMTR